MRYADMTPDEFKRHAREAYETANASRFTARTNAALYLAGRALDMRYEWNWPDIAILADQCDELILSLDT